MSVFLVLALSALATAAILLCATGLRLLRAESRALGHWLLGWSALLGAAFVTLLAPRHPPIQALGPLFTTFVAPMMLLGAAVHSGRVAPLWIVPSAFFVGVVRMSAWLLGEQHLTTAIAMATEPVVAGIAAWFVLHPSPARRAPLAASDRLLALGLACYGGVEFFDAYSRTYDFFGWANWIAWLAVALPLFTLQILLHLDRVNRTSRAHEEDARANAMRLRLLEDSSQDYLCEFTDRGILTYLSPSAVAAMGHPAETMLGRDIEEFFVAETRSPMAIALKACGQMTAEDVTSSSGKTNRIRYADGSEHWIEFSGNTYRTLAGELRVVARIRDVTEKTDQEEALRRNETRLRRAERIAGLGSWELEVRSRVLSFSDELLRIHGLPTGRSRFDTSVLGDLVHPEDVEKASFPMDRARSTGEPFELVYRIRRADDGAIRTLRAFGESDRDADGDIVRLVGATIDITEQVELLDRLRLGQERFQSLVDSDIVCVHFAHRDGRITEANTAFLSLLGYAKEDLPLDWRELTAPEFREADEKLVALSDIRKVPQPFEKAYLTRDGRSIPMLMSITALSPDDVIAIGVDLTARKQAEAARERHEQELEATVEARTQELIQSRNRLLENERLAVVGTLTAGVAHQINNPIGAILNCAEYALLCREDDDARAIFERALRDNLTEARRCAQIVRSMLQFSRDQPTAKWVEDLKRVARRAHRAISAYAKDRAAKIDFETADERLLVRISPIEIEQAIVNVLRNAIESRPNGARVALRLSRRDKSAILEITDDGRGIEPVHHERLFEPFFSTRAREGGTGLGLSVTHGIVVDHGGQIRIESVPGLGTRVTITLPIDESAG